MMKTRRRQRKARIFSSLGLVLVLVLASFGVAAAFVPLHDASNRRRFGSDSSSLSSFLDRLHGESEDAYFRRATAAASDSATFERTVLGQEQEKNKPAVTAAQVNGKRNGMTDGDHDDTGSDAPKPKKGYVRAEEWEAEEQRRKKNGELTWEERVQFEGQQYGNRVNQNDILRHHLNAFK